MTREEKILLAKNLNGLLGTGSLNWLSDYNMEFKKEQINIFFKKENEALKALSKIPKLKATIIKTPKHVNVYFKYCLNILL